MKSYVTSALGFALVMVPVQLPKTLPSMKLVNRCETIQNKIQQRVDNYTTRKDNHLEIYQKLHDRLVGVADKLEDKGLDVSNLRTDLAKLQDMVTQAKTAYEAFITKIEGVKIVDCETGKVEFKGILADARGELQNFRQKAREIHNFIQNTIRTDLRELKNKQTNG